jgi:hypothetical protein
MTLNAQEVFMIELGRVSKTAHKFLHARGLQRADRDDVISAAMLWCWENRDSYSLTTTLETWFMNTVRNAYQDLRRNELPTSDESLENLSGGEDPTYSIVAAESSAKALIDALTPTDKKVAWLIMQGFTREEMMEKGIPHDVIYAARARIKQLRRLIPDEARSKRLVQTAAWVGSDDADRGESLGGQSNLDKQLERLEFAPPTGKDCPPCWRCMWFEGFMPASELRSTRMDIEDLEVREAVKNTEARKIEIAQQVRDGV